MFIIELLGFSLKMGVLDASRVTRVLPGGEFCNKLYQPHRTTREKGAAEAFSMSDLYGWCWERGLRRPNQIRGDFTAMILRQNLFFNIRLFER
jgi:hypothetical protein